MAHSHPPSFSSPVQVAARVRFGERAVLVTMLSMLVSLAGIFYTWWLLPQPEALWPLVGLAVSLVVFGAAWWAVHTQRFDLATLLYYIAVAAWAVPLVLTCSGLGGPAFFLMLFVLLVFNQRVATASKGSWFSIIAVVLALTPIFIEYFLELDRITLPNAFYVIAWALVGVVGAPVVWSMVRHFDALQLRTRLTILMLVVGIIPLGVLGLVVNLFTRQALVDAANTKLLGDARQVANVVDTFINFTLDSVRTESRLLDMVEYMEALAQADRPPTAEARLRVEASMRELVRKDPVFIASYALVDAFGVVRLSTLESEIGLDWSDRPFVQVPLSRSVPYVSDVFVENNQGQLYFSAPVRARSGQVVGLLVVRYRADILQDRVRRSSGDFAEGYQAVLIDADNIRIAQSAFPELIYTLLVTPSPEEFSRLQQANRLPRRTLAELTTQASDLVASLTTLETTPVFSIRTATTGQEPNLVAAVRLQNPVGRSWVVAYAQKERSFLRPVNAQVRIVLLSGILSALAIAMFAAVVARLASAPLVNLTEVAARIGRGDLSARAVVQGRDEVAVLAQTFNLTASQLQDTLTSLERRVQERTRALQTSVEVSRRLSTIVNQDELLTQVVNQVQAAFNYYHVQVYLVDDTRAQLVLAGGTGEAGQTLLGRNHRLPLGRGVVGRAAQTNQAVLVSDVSRDPSWLPNPLLPDTRSEMAVPITVGETVLGVLDVQHITPGGLTNDDMELLQSLANQVAVALQNIRAYEATRQQARRESLLNTINQKILGTASIDEALQVAARELGEATGAQRALVQLRQAHAEPPTNEPLRILP